MIDVDYKYFLSINYGTENNCSESGCNEEGICRCTTILNAKVESIKFSSLVEEIHKQHFSNRKSLQRNNILNSILYSSTEKIDHYLIDRVLRINKIFISDNWTIDISSGYYGQEIDRVCLNYELAKKIEQEITTGLQLFSLNEKVEYLLMLEYGQILPQLKNREWEIKNISIKQISIPNKNHFNKCQNLSDYYQIRNYQLIRGIVIEDGQMFRLVDGYHRISELNCGEWPFLVAKA